MNFCKEYYTISIFVRTRLLTHSNLTNSERVNVAAVECLSEFGQQDSEYTEDYASVAQRQLDSLTEQIVPTEHLALAPVPKPRYVHDKKRLTGVSRIVSCDYKICYLTLRHWFPKHKFAKQFPDKLECVPHQT